MSDALTAEQIAVLRSLPIKNETRLNPGYRHAEDVLIAMGDELDYWQYDSTAGLALTATGKSLLATLDAATRASSNEGSHGDVPEGGTPDPNPDPSESPSTPLGDGERIEHRATEAKLAKALDFATKAMQSAAHYEHVGAESVEAAGVAHTAYEDFEKIVNLLAPNPESGGAQ